MEIVSEKTIKNEAGAYLRRSLGSCADTERALPEHDDHIVLITAPGKQAYRAVICRVCGLADPKF